MGFLDSLYVYRSLGLSLRLIYRLGCIAQNKDDMNG